MRMKIARAKSPQLKFLLLFRCTDATIMCLKLFIMNYLREFKTRYHNIFENF
jgi:hypothetical protein